MAITVNALLGWCRAPANTRVAVIAALMPGGIIELADFSVDEIQEATKSFSRLPVDAFVLSPHTTKRLVQLTLWAKDKARLYEVPMFPNATTQVSFASQINETQRQDSIRTERKKTGEALSSVRIDPPLKSSAGWEGWMVAVEAALTLAYGSKGVPLSYVIRENEAPQPNGHATWELKAIHAAPLTGLDYEAD
jgi:hypothetical protein